MALSLIFFGYIYIYAFIHINFEYRSHISKFNLYHNKFVSKKVFIVSKQNIFLTVHA